MSTTRTTGGASRMLRGALGVGMALGVAWRAGAQQILRIDVITAPPHNFGLGGGLPSTVFLSVRFDANILSVTPGSGGGLPQLALGTQPVTRQAQYMFFSGPEMIFRYDVQPGDFARDLECVNQFALSLGGAAVQTSAGPFWGGSNPLFPAAGALRTGYDVNVTTMGFVGTPATNVTVGHSVTWRVTRDLSSAFLPVPGTPLNNIAVTVTPPPPGGALTVPSFVAIPGGSNDADVTITGHVAGGPYWIAFTPPGYPNYPNPGAGSFSNRLTVAAAFLPAITNIQEHARVLAPGLAYGRQQSLRIAVTFNQNIASYNDLGGRARLRLGTYPNRRYAICQGLQVGRDDTLIFLYEVYPGDFAQDLDTDNTIGFELNGATLTLARSGAVTGPLPWPRGTEAGALRLTSDIHIRTVDFVGPVGTTVPEGAEIVPPWTITRGLRNDGTPAPEALGFEVTTAGGTSVIAYTSPLTILAAQEIATFSVTGLVAGTATQVRLRPLGYPTSGAGDLLANVTVTAGPQPFITVTPALLFAPESNTDTYTLTVTLSRNPIVSTTVNVTSANPARLEFLGGGGLRTLTFAPGGPLSQNVQVVPIDGTATVAVTATDPSAVYLSGSATVTVQNVAPFVPPGAGYAVPSPSVRNAVVNFFLAPTLIQDVVADRTAGFMADWYWGDGSPNLFNRPVTAAPVPHAFAAAGIRTVNVVVRDKDNAPVTNVTIVVVVEEGFNVLVRITGRGVGRNYLGLTEGLGRGNVTANNALPIGDTGLLPDLTRTFTYQPAPTNNPPVTSQLTATPVTVTIGAVTHDSFFHVWEGEGFTSPDAIVPISSSPRMILVDQSREVGAVFSREYYPADGWGDIDVDELPDLWERQYGLDFHVPNRGDNPDNDFLPRGASAALGYPAAGNNYTPDGIGFAHVFEVRGLHAGLNAAASQNGLASFGPSGPPDEPRRGTYTAAGTFTQSDARSVFGTDPTNIDTDSDRFGDGWEYYFWMNAVVRNITGEAYDPTRVIAGTVIPWPVIAASFNPVVAGALDANTDGDGLTNYEEMLLGTNPIHWDTDGDGMADGWEVFRILDPLAGDAGDNTDGDWMALDAVAGLRHFQVYGALEYDPRTAWNLVYVEKNRTLTFPQPNTVRFTNYEEYRLARFYIDVGWVGSVPATPAAWGAWTTNPLSADTDGDLQPDGWEMYVAYNALYGFRGFHPSSAAFGDALSDYDLDDLINRAEFHGQESCAVYGFANVNARWWNKFWPTDPWNADTDGEGLPDGFEGDATFQYDSGYVGYIRGSRPGGMLNPCSVDTDMDYLPDYFEWQYFGENIGTGIIDGMDGTYFDSVSGPDAITGLARNFDFDGDGLENYQEYWINAVYHFNYDKWSPGLGYGGYDPIGIFYGAPHAWDWAILANYWQNGELPPVPFVYIPPEGRPLVLLYACGDPRLWDTDEDDMDDYYEMFHALNPLWSLTVDAISKPIPIPPHYDFRLVPWKVGEQTADPDQDGIPNFEEALIPNRPEPMNHNTDPSPLWKTDVSYDQSWVNLYYNLGSVPMYWATNVTTRFPAPALMLGGARPSYVFSFESNEGYDADNDNLQDKQETIGSTVAGVTDPLNSDSPRRRKALYLSGNAAARTRTGFAHGPDALRSWTIEAWVKPANPAGGRRQIILERPVAINESDTMPATEYVRRTFRLGIEWDGAPFVEYDNAGKDVLTERAIAQDWPLSATNWTHLAATMSGVDRRLTLYIDGQVAASRPTASIPATGFIAGTPLLFRRAPLVIGASDANPDGTVSGAFHYWNNLLLPRPSQPVLADFFTGWVDEVRIWDGARPQAEIKADFDARKRYTQADVIASRETTVRALSNLLSNRGIAQTTMGLSLEGYSLIATDWLMRTGGETTSVRLPPTLLYHYAFDNLPDPRHEPVVPNSFEALNGRPLDGSYPGVPWWHSANDRSTVYRTFDANPYLFAHWVENTVAHLPIGLLDTNGFFRGTATLNSMYWTHYRTGHTVLTNGFVNVFRNSANPYGFTYRHARNRFLEDHPEFTFDARFDPTLSTQYNNLLPLREAVADMEVPLWDNGTPGTADYDSDGDGLPDWWEIQYGLAPYDATGLNGAFADPDGDGLSSRAEYLAGTNPFARDSDGDGIADYDDRSGNPLDDQRSFGERFTDGDRVEDAWEALWSQSHISPQRYDEHLDLDGDGWSNWSERRVDLPTRPDRVVGAVQLNGRNFPEYPQPSIEVTLDYTGTRNLTTGTRTLVVQAYTDAAMNGRPDAVFSLPLGATATTTFAPVGRYDGRGFVRGLLAPGWLLPTTVAFTHSPPPGNTPFDLATDDGAGRLIWTNLVTVIGTIDYISGRFTLDLRQIPVGSAPLDGDAFYATYDYRVETLSWPVTLTLRQADLNGGHVREGINYFHAFLNLDGSTYAGSPSWTPGDPAAVADALVPGTGVGWDTAMVRFGLTDTARSRARFSWATLVPPDNEVPRTITINRAGGATIFTKVIEAPRTWIHEGDFIVGRTNSFGLDWGAISTNSVYEWRMDGFLRGAFTNAFAGTLDAPVLDFPAGAWVKSARPVFKWRMAPEATEFDIEVRRLSVGGTLVYAGRHVAPARQRVPGGTAVDYCVWEFPFHAGDVMPNGQVFSNQAYVWRVRAYSPRTTTGSAWSVDRGFMLDVQSDPATSGGMGWFDVRVIYPSGRAMLPGGPNRIRVQAFTTRSFNDVPEAQRTLSATGTVTLAGLAPGTYYVRAFVDQNNNRERDVWESYGYLRSEDDSSAAFGVLGVRAEITPFRRPAVVTIRDGDTDQDLIPDGLEFIMHGAGGGNWLAVAGPGPVVSSPAYSDFDGDGLNDLSELKAGSSVFRRDTDSDGIDDWLEYQLGLNPNVPSQFAISAAQFLGTTMDLQWTLRPRSHGVAAPMGAGQPEPVRGLLRQVEYVVEHTPTLINPAWREVARTRSLVTAGSMAVPTRTGQPEGFYRVVMLLTE